jgi:hypothetical protein
MKRLLAFVLSALFAIHAAEARTIYVNVKRPNNKGNGLKVKSAKKTIQSAINIAKNGDTILVYPGTYSPIKTNNKKITIKSVKGKLKTKIKAHNSAFNNLHALNLGKGNATTVTGFFVHQNNNSGTGNVDGAVFGGKVRNSTFSKMGGKYGWNQWPHDVCHTFFKTKLIDCVLDRCAPGTGGTCMIYASTLNRCIISRTTTFYGGNFLEASTKSSKLANCLFVGNTGFYDSTKMIFQRCRIHNCTFAENPDVRIRSSKMWNSIVYNCGGGVTGKKAKNSFSRCKFGGNPCFVENPKITEKKIVEVEYYEGRPWTYEHSEYKVSLGDCRLTKESPCIDSGKLTKAQKKLVGTKDLAGRKRIRGKAIDLGCYEY